MSITTGDFRQRVTVHTLAEKKSKHEPIVSLTAYDYATARIADEAGVDFILVGDSLAQVVLGYDSTLPVTMDEMLHHTRAVRRAVRHAFLVTDMPFGSYHTGTKAALKNAVRCVKEGGAEAVKIEGGTSRVPLISRMIDAEIPVVGHIGLTPQSVNKMGGYKVQGKTASAIDELLRDAAALDEAGVAALVLEGIPREVATRITREVSTPTIGIGAGPDCDGQILVFHDLAGMTFNTPAKFVRRYCNAGELIGEGIQAYRDDVRSRAFPADGESYHLPRETQRALDEAQQDTPAVHHK
ncbi:MAG TPA: 3-methyl-2-oxobutanoate hydroxymethyltransferase [Candidatus Saccharimonadales bacterium]|nr:3-methyl-2-oxobutanoate hydroxymethyltransferase [Candidatus Saccharimonadales bacterium]